MIPAPVPVERMRYYHAENATQGYEVDGVRIDFKVYGSFAGSLRGVIAVQSSQARKALDYLTERRVGVREITEAEFLDKSRNILPYTSKKTLSFRSADSRPTTSNIEVPRNRFGTAPSFYHSGDLGDIVYSLLACKELGGGFFYLGPEMKVPERNAVTRVMMTQDHANLILPLIKSQPYIKDAKFDARMPLFIDYDFNQFRPFFWGPRRDEMESHGAKKPYSIARAHASTFGLRDIDETKPWIFIEDKLPILDHPIVINRTARYRNPLFDWKVIYRYYGRKMIFVGSKSEHEEFCTAFGDVEYFPTANLYELARVIAGSELFIGNQSCANAIAEGLKHPLIQETSSQAPDCMFQRKAYYVQGRVEEKELPRPKRKQVVIQCYPENQTGLGQTSCSIIKGFQDCGYAVGVVNSRESVKPEPFFTPLITNSKRADFAFQAVFENWKPGCVAYTMWESSAIRKEWAKALNTQKLVIVPTEWTKESFQKSGVKAPIKVIPLFIENKFTFRRPSFSGPFVFGCGGRILHGNRKGIDEVIAAFRKAFPEDAEVALRIKISPDDPRPDTFGDPRIEIISKRLTQDEMVEFYAGLNCFAHLAYGEGWGLMPHQAMAVGRPLIATNWGGVTGFTSSDTMLEVDYELQPARGDYNGLGDWAIPSIESSAKAMQKAFSMDRNHLEVMGYKAHMQARKFNPETIIPEIIKAVHEA